MIQTPRSDIYVAMLGIALGAIVIGSILLALVMNRYEWKRSPTGSISHPTTQVALYA